MIRRSPAGTAAPSAGSLPMGLYALAVLVGVIAGLGAVAFRGLIALIHNAFFLGQLSWTYDANVHTPASPWGPLVVLVPVAGAIAVVFLVRNFAPEARGHGVPEVMDATYYNGGIIRPIVAAIKALASAFSIGTGGSVGREGPIIQIGAAFGSTLGQVIRMPQWQRITLVAAGAGGGIAATFNTPIGGMLFAIEIMLPEVSVRTLLPVGISTITATYVGRYVFGVNPSFVIPSLQGAAAHIANPAALLLYAGLGIALGLASAAFIVGIYGTEDRLDRWIPGRDYLRHAAGMLLVGLMMYVSARSLGQYYVEGVGYSTIQDILSGTLASVPVLATLFALKLLATSLTLGSGASGGIFSPALYLGATLGGAYGVVAATLFPALGIGVPTFAVAGMAGAVGGVTGAAMASIVMIFEMTGDYAVIIPMMLTVVLSYAVRRHFVKDSIYTMKLSRRGHFVPAALHANLHSLRRVGDHMIADFTRIRADSFWEEVARHVGEHPGKIVLVEGEAGPVGVILPSRQLDLLCRGEAGGAPRSGPLPPALVDSHFILASEHDAFFDVVVRMRRKGVDVALITAASGESSAASPGGPPAVVGILTLGVLARSLQDQAEMFTDESG